MATTTNPNRKRVYAEFSVGADKYAIKVANGNTKGSLFTTMGYTDKGEKLPAGTIELTRDAALDNGLVVGMVAEVKTGTRTSYKRIYIPAGKLEETVKQGAGKTLGTGTVNRVRSIRTKVVI
jgi:hypothetical protein